MKFLSVNDQTPIQVLRIDNLNHLRLTDFDFGLHLSLSLMENAASKMCIEFVGRFSSEMRIEVRA